MRCRTCKRSFRATEPIRNSHHWNKGQCYHCHYLVQSQLHIKKNRGDIVRGCNPPSGCNMVCSNTLRLGKNLSKALLKLST